MSIIRHLPQTQLQILLKKYCPSNPLKQYYPSSFSNNVIHYAPWTVSSAINQCGPSDTTRRGGVPRCPYFSRITISFRFPFRCEHAALKIHYGGFDNIYFTRILLWCGNHCNCLNESVVTFIISGVVAPASLRRSRICFNGIL